MIDPRAPNFESTPVSRHRPRCDYAPADSTAPPAVSIVTPFFETGEVFLETARSVLQQSLQQWEWIIVNDGSRSAEARALLDWCRELDSRIRVIDHPDNCGLPAARNTGFRAARADFVAQLDSDDLLEPTTLEKWRWFLESRPECAFVDGFSVGFARQRYLWRGGFCRGRDSLDENVIDNKAMIRKSTHQTVGGYDESLRSGMEDWEFWLRCANGGHWGGTVPEFLAWYRRREDHSDRWSELTSVEARKRFRAALREKYGDLWNGRFPEIDMGEGGSGGLIAEGIPFTNRLRKSQRHLLLIVPWMAVGGVDRFNCDLIQQLLLRGWGVTIVATLQHEHPWLPSFAQLTPDVFVLPHFLRLLDYPRFLHYLIRSRGTDVVLATHSELGYLLLPYLRSRCPSVAFADYCHIEDETWRAGGYPRLSLDCQYLLDLQLVSSRHLRRWMIERGGDEDRIEVCTTNVGLEAVPSDPRIRREERDALGIDEETCIVLYVARLCEQKRPRLFAATIDLLARRNRRLVALVVGEGPERDWLAAFVDASLAKQHIRLLGETSNEHVRRLMSAADLFFLPSRWEGIALSIYEAMAAGLCVVAADVGGQSELVTPDCGVLLPNDADEATLATRYADVLFELLADPERRRQLGDAARRRVRQSFSIETMGQRMSELLEGSIALDREARRPVPPRGLSKALAEHALENERLRRIVR